MQKKNFPKGEIIIYRTTKGPEIEAKLQKETLCLMPIKWPGFLMSIVRQLSNTYAIYTKQES